MVSRVYLPVDVIKDSFLYDPDTGKFFHKKRSRLLFKTERAWKTWNTKHSGKLAGNQEGNYWILSIANNSYEAHRVAWAIMTGEWPASGIDHKNGRGLDNRFKNLREATQKQNLQNYCLRKDSTSGYTGVSWDKSRRKWYSRITIDYKSKFLGYHSTKERAFQAYLEAKKVFHTFNPIPR